MSEKEWRDRYMVRLHDFWRMSWEESTEAALAAEYISDEDPRDCADTEMSYS